MEAVQCESLWRERVRSLMITELKSKSWRPHKYLESLLTKLDLWVLLFTK